MPKIQTFEYIVKKIVDWVQETGVPSKEFYPSLNKLKIIKLHFFVCSISTKIEKEDNDLFRCFDNFYALPLGPVESNIYESINRDELVFYTISKAGTAIKTDFNLQLLNLQANEIELIDKSFDLLKLINPNIIDYSSFDLVELSHKWSSWITTFDAARQNNAYSKRIPLNLLRTEQKIFAF